MKQMWNKISRSPVAPSRVGLLALLGLSLLALTGIAQAGPGGKAASGGGHKPAGGGGYKPSGTAYKPSGTAYKPSSTAYKPSGSAGYKPSSTGYKPGGSTAYKTSGGGYKPSGGGYKTSGGGHQPSKKSQVINNKIILNITNIKYIRKNNGFVISGNSQLPLCSDCVLDPGDVILSVGGVSTSDTALSLQELVEGAYERGNTTVRIRDVNTGRVDEVELDRAEGSGTGDLEGLVLVGSENLGNYGRLEFRFQSGGRLTMIDTDGSTGGTYAFQGDSLNLTFFNGSVVYSGSFDGESLSGTARNRKTSWSFSVRR